MVVGHSALWVPLTHFAHCLHRNLFNNTLSELPSGFLEDAPALDILYV